MLIADAAYYAPRQMAPCLQLASSISLECIPLSKRHSSLRSKKHPRLDVEPLKDRSSRRLDLSMISHAAANLPHKPDVQPFSEFRRESSTPEGTLIIEPIQEEDVNAAAVVLTRAFATSPQGIPLNNCR
jgi:hypothetical protein